MDCCFSELATTCVGLVQKGHHHLIDMQLVLGMIQRTNSPLGVKQQSLTLSFSMFKVLLQPNIQKQALNLKVLVFFSKELSRK
jgi:hypothetical protein